MAEYIKLKPYKLERNDDHPDGGRHYLLPNKQWAHSVTNWLDKSSDKTGLEEWRDRIGHERADQIRDLAAARGNAMHNMAEQYLLHGVEPEFSFFYTPYWNSLRIYLDKYIKHTVLCESSVWHEEDCHAGTIDHLGYYYNLNGLVLSDWKSADKPLKDFKIYTYKMQGAAYIKSAERVYAAQELYIPHLRIVCAMPDQMPFVIEAERDEIEQLYVHFINRKRYF